MKINIKFYDSVPVGSNIFESYLKGLTEEAYASIEFAYAGAFEEGQNGGWLEPVPVEIATLGTTKFIRSSSNSSVARFVSRNHLQESYSTFKIPYFNSFTSFVSNQFGNEWELPLIAPTTGDQDLISSYEYTSLNTIVYHKNTSNHFNDFIPYSAMKITSLGTNVYGINAFTFNGIYQPTANYTLTFDVNKLTQLTVAGITLGAASPVPLTSSGILVEDVIYKFNTDNSGLTLSGFQSLFSIDSSNNFVLTFRDINFTVNTTYILLARSSSAHRKYGVLLQDTSLVDLISTDTFRIYDATEGTLLFNLSVNALKSMYSSTEQLDISTKIAANNTAGIVSAGYATQAEVDVFTASLTGGETSDEKLSKFYQALKFNIIIPEVLKEDISQTFVNYESDYGIVPSEFSEFLVLSVDDNDVYTLGDPFQSEATQTGAFITRREASNAFNSVVLAIRYNTSINYENLAALQTTKHYPDVFRMYFYAGIASSTDNDDLRIFMDTNRKYWYNKDVFNGEYFPVHRVEENILQYGTEDDLTGVQRINPTRAIRRSQGGLPAITYVPKEDVESGTLDEFVRVDAKIPEPQHIQPIAVKSYIAPDQELVVHRGETVIHYGRLRIYGRLVLSDEAIDSDTDALLESDVVSKLIIL